MRRKSGKPDLRGSGANAGRGVEQLADIPDIGVALLLASGCSQPERSRRPSVQTVS